jgi:phosphogluconate dehydratase
MHPTVLTVTARIQARSADSRSAYRQRVQAAHRAMQAAGRGRDRLSCTNLAHAYAAVPANGKLRLKAEHGPNLAIVSSYNDMLSAHQPFEHYPAIIKEAAFAAGGTAQFAGGVPAMCDGVTQGQVGMELSLFSRDTIAMATAVALSHNAFDGVLCLGICDKIVPGLLIGALHFGHLPTVFVPGGPMASGVPNSEKARIRQLYAEGKVGREELLEAEMASYHGPGTCTFYGTANSNQMLMEAMGLHVPAAAFVNPHTPLRERLTVEATHRVMALARERSLVAAVGEIVNERSLVNAIAVLHATGGSTNHTLHVVAIAKAAGIMLTWDDFNDLSRVVPLIARVYPNGKADVNQFQACGGTGFVIRELLAAGLMHDDVETIAGHGLQRYASEPRLAEGELRWEPAPTQSPDGDILRSVQDPFDAEGGMRLLTGNLGRAIIKVSAVPRERWRVDAPARVFDDQDAVMHAFEAGELDKDVVVVVRFQGPRANGMPELHKLTPALAVLQDRGFHVALVTDGRMSGASGKVPAAIHVTPEAADGGPLACLQDGDRIVVDATAGELSVALDASALMARPRAPFDERSNAYGSGRELFGVFRTHAAPAEGGATIF